MNSTKKMHKTVGVFTNPEMQIRRQTIAVWLQNLSSNAQDKRGVTWGDISSERTNVSVETRSRRVHEKLSRKNILNDQITSETTSYTEELLILNNMFMKM